MSTCEGFALHFPGLQLSVNEQILHHLGHALDSGLDSRELLGSLLSRSSGPSNLPSKEAGHDNAQRGAELVRNHAHEAALDLV
jgi:hypothetical protein